MVAKLYTLQNSKSKSVVTTAFKTCYAPINTPTLIDFNDSI